MPPKPKIYYSEDEKRRDLQRQELKQQQAKPRKEPARAAAPIRHKKRFSAAQSSAPYSLDRLPNRFPKNAATSPQAPTRMAVAPAPAPVRRPKRSHALSVKTAEAIANDHTHPKQSEVAELLKTLRRGWIDADRFNELLTQLIL